MKKKVLFVITKSNFGGAQKYVYEHATSLPSDTYDVVVALGGAGGRGETQGELARRLEHSHIRSVFVHSFERDMRLYSDLRIFFELAEIIRMEKPDVIHLNSSKAVVAGALAALFEGVPKRIATVHGWAFREDRPAWQRGLIALTQWFSSLFLTHIIVLHSKDALAWPFIGRRMHLIHNTLRAPAFLPREEARTALLSLAGIAAPADARWLGSIAELTRNKGHIYALQALAKLDTPYTYFVLGGGELLFALEEEAKKLGISGSVLFLGHVPDAARYMAAFDAYLLPSVKEGWPYAALEAAAAGVPIAATDVGGVREMLGEDISLARPRDPDSFVTVLRQALTPEAKRAASHIQERVTKEFAHEHMLERVRALYDAT